MAVDHALVIESLRSLQQAPSVPRNDRPAERPVPPGVDFEASLQQALGREPKVRFSGHARSRLASRGLALGGADVRRLEQAVDKAAAKGSRDSLILMDDLALIVSIKNRTVVTAVDSSSQREGVFTNIDSVVLAHHE
jgi:flagellar operon protein